MSVVRYRGTQSSTNAFSRDVNVFRASGFVYNTGTVAVVDGFALDMRNLSTGTVTAMSGIHVPAMSNSGGGAITTTYGVKVDALGVGSTRYAFYQAGTSDINYFAGEVRVLGDIGGVASANTLTGVSNIAANSTGVGTIKFKGATNRDSTGFIKIYIGTTAYYVPVFSAITG